MIQKTDLYLTFSGNCEQALEFYRECFRGEILRLRKSYPANISQTGDSQVLYAEFMADGLHFSASDRILCEQPISYGNNVLMSLLFHERDEMLHVFNALSRNGKVNIPMHETLWGTCTGMLTDSFGISWILYKDTKNT